MSQVSWTKAWKMTLALALHIASFACRPRNLGLVEPTEGLQCLAILTKAHIWSMSHPTQLAQTVEEKSFSSLVYHDASFFLCFVVHVCPVSLRISPIHSASPETSFSAASGQVRLASCAVVDLRDSRQHPKQLWRSANVNDVYDLQMGGKFTYLVFILWTICVVGLPRKGSNDICISSPIISLCLPLITPNFTVSLHQRMQLLVFLPLHGTTDIGYRQPKKRRITDPVDTWHWYREEVVRVYGTSSDHFLILKPGLNMPSIESDLFSKPSWHAMAKWQGHPAGIVPSPVGHLDYLHSLISQGWTSNDVAVFQGWSLPGNGEKGVEHP